jgi:protocatechuate 3,4-dioxygenase beta subunit
MLAIYTVLVALLFNQAPPTADAAGRVAGRVTAAGSEAPVVGARVMLLPAGPRIGSTGGPPRIGPMGGPPPQAVTNQDGRFVFERLRPGTYTLAVEKTGYAASIGPSNARKVEVTAGQSIDGVDLHLERGAVIAGRVLDPAGEPLADARVTAMRRVSPPDGAATRLLPAPGPGQQTNDLGEFRIASLPPGEYYVAAMPRRVSMMFGAAGTTPATRAPGSPRTTLATTFYPGTPDQAAAHPVAVAAGAEVGNIVFTMQSVPSFRVSGIVVDEQGTPVSDAMVTLVGDPRSGMFMGPVGGTRTQANGRFDIDEVPAGSYRVMASVVMTVTSSGVGSGGGGAGWVSSAGGRGEVSGSYVTGSTFLSGAGTTVDQPTEIVVVDADVKGVRVPTRRPMPR